MASGIKNLAYPQLDIDDRLGKAHTHHNMEYINAIGEDEIGIIENAALKDLSNVTIETFSNKMKETGLAFIDVSTDDAYVRVKGSWMKLHDAQLFPSVSSSSLSISGSGTSSLVINLKDSDIASIGSISSKLDKLSIYKTNEVVTANSDGTIKSSGVDINSVIVSSKLVQDATNNTSTTSAVSAKAANDIIKKINSLSDGIGKPRGVVVNAFVSMGSVSSLSSLPAIKSGGKGYTVGSLVRLYTNTSSDLIPAVARITDIVSNTGAVTGVEIVTGGSYSSLSSSAVFHLVPSSKSPTSTNVATLSGSFTQTSVAKSTLNSITNPRVGDTAYVLEDENDNNFQAIYNYVESDNMGYWIRIISFASPDANYVQRFTQ